MRRVGCGLLNRILPDDCRVCGNPLQDFSRIPVCSNCLHAPEPFAAEFYCSDCRMPFVSRFPLDEQGRCALCRQGLRGFEAAYTYGSYEGTLRELVHLFKYQGIQSLTKPFGDWLALALPREKQFDVIIPMPLHWWKRWQRGFNQSELLAQEIGKRWHVPVRPVIRRTKRTGVQAGLTHAQRRANVQGAFAVRPGVRLDGLRVLLVDDVITTGSTASACARAIKRAGAARVEVLALARTDRRMTVDAFRKVPDQGRQMSA